MFAHFFLIFGANHEKLSKRKHFEADVMAHKTAGVLPHALLNTLSHFQIVVENTIGHADCPAKPLHRDFFILGHENSQLRLHLFAQFYSMLPVLLRTPCGLCLAHTGT